MHWIQSKLLELSKVHDLTTTRKADLVKLVGCNYQSQIDHHLSKLIEDGQLVKRNGHLKGSLSNIKSIFKVPIMGEADCGEATRYADGRIHDYLTLSPSVSKIKHPNSTYALLARGDSMTKAGINDGDYVIVERKATYDNLDGKIIVSNIGGLANIKRCSVDNTYNRIVLLSESYDRDSYAPIIISPDDEYDILGEVVDIIKSITHIHATR
jgi:SOS-response transcriptional repressor LexA